MSVRVEYDSNNSRGEWWLRDEDWQKLEAAGWEVQWWSKNADPMFRDKDGRFLGALATRAAKRFSSLREGVSEWESITGQSADEEGCPCCGPPHNFSGKTDDGKYVSFESSPSGYSRSYGDEA